MSHGPTRRDFLKYTALAAGAAAAGCAAPGGPTPRPAATQPRAAFRKVNVGFIGVGGRGGGDLADCVAAGCNVVALCDVDLNSLNRAAAAHPGAKTYRDYRKMLESQKDLEAVVVATPDHHHFPASMMAIQLGKHVYCEKPLTHSVWEARQLTLAARKMKVATQMGNQGHASEGHRLTVEWVQAGVIGKVREVYVWTDRPRNWWPQGIDRPQGEAPVPANLDWDLWLGPAPHRPYHAVQQADGKWKGTYCPFVWRGWWDYGTGALGDIGCHAIDVPNWALNLGAPSSVQAHSFGATAETGPLWSDVIYQFPARGSLPPVKLTWYDGRNPTTPRDDPAWFAIGMLRAMMEISDKDPFPGGGELFVGDKGLLVTTGGGPRLVPESRMKDFARPPKTLPRSIGHHAEWLVACAGGPPSMDHFDYAGPLAETVLMGNLALRLGRRIEWDSRNLKAVGCPEADALIRREYRKGWDIA